jgi:NAD(P)-dependent dehydrogenase (short-subunit alcohol dehydrogenase family)
LELAKHRIRVNVICPGGITTNIGESTEQRNIEEAREPIEFPEGVIPLTDGQPGDAEQVADLVYFLASDASNHISGTEIWIDGAQSLLQG